MCNSSAVRSLLIVSLLLAVAACGPSKKKCDAKVTKMRGVWNSMAPLRQLWPVSPKLQLPKSRSAKRIGRAGVAVTVFADGSYEAFGKRGDLKQLAVGLKREADVIDPEKMPGGKLKLPVPLYVYADGRVAVQRLIQVLDRVPDKLQARLAVYRPDDRSRFLAARDASDWTKKHYGAWKTKSQDERVEHVAAGIERSAGSCGKILAAFAAAADTPSSLKFDTMRRGSDKALRDCGCSGVRLDDFHYAMLQLNGAYGRPQGWLGLTKRDVLAKLAKKNADVAKLVATSY